MTIIPRPRRLVPGEGRFRLSAATTIAAAAGAAQVAASLAAQLAQRDRISAARSQ